MLLTRTTYRLFVGVLFAAALPGVASAQRGGGPTGPQPTTNIEPLRFRYMGPAPAGRIASVAGVPADPNAYYVGSASRGVWKSTAGGPSFLPITHTQPAPASGSIAGAATPP